MEDCFEYVIKDYLETKKTGWSPFELHIVRDQYQPDDEITETFMSYRCLLKRTERDSKNFITSYYYDMIGNIRANEIILEN